MNKKLILVSMCALLAGCATGYQSQNFFGNGFSEVKTSPDSFIVNYQGNAYSKGDKMMQYALRRASELTVENGFKYFKIIQTMDTSSYTGSSGGLSKTPAYNIRIKCFNEKPENDPDIVEAGFYLNNNL